MNAHQDPLGCSSTLGIPCRTPHQARRDEQDRVGPRTIRARTLARPRPVLHAAQHFRLVQRAPGSRARCNLSGLAPDDLVTTSRRRCLPRRPARDIEVGVNPQYSPAGMRPPPRSCRGSSRRRRRALDPGEFVRTRCTRRVVPPELARPPQGRPSRLRSSRDHRPRRRPGPCAAPGQRLPPPFTASPQAADRLPTRGRGEATTGPRVQLRSPGLRPVGWPGGALTACRPPSATRGRSRPRVAAPTQDAPSLTGTGPFRVVSGVSPVQLGTNRDPGGGRRPRPDHMAPSNRRAPAVTRSGLPGVEPVDPLCREDWIWNGPRSLQVPVTEEGRPWSCSASPAGNPSRQPAFYGPGNSAAVPAVRQLRRSVGPAS